MEEQIEASKNEKKSKQNDKIMQAHQILLQNKKSLTMTGVTRVDSTNETGVSVMIGDTPLDIVGTDIHISKLDVEKGVIELDGDINTIKYNQKSKGNFVKRLFK